LRFGLILLTALAFGLRRIAILLTALGVRLGLVALRLLCSGAGEVAGGAEGFRLLPQGVGFVAGLGGLLPQRLGLALGGVGRRLAVVGLFAIGGLLLLLA